MLGQRRESNLKVQVRMILFALFMAVGIGFILSYDLIFAPQVSLVRGQAADQDIVTPERVVFVSQLLTEAEKRQAAAAVPDNYDPLDRQVGREQVGLALMVLSFIDSVRADTFASPEYQRFCMESIEAVSLNPQVISETLFFDEPEWKTVQLETRQVLDEIMKREIKAGQEDARRREVRTLIDFELSEPQTMAVDTVASSLVKANRTLNLERTELARQVAMDSVQPITRALEANEIIVRSGEVVTDLNIEALDALGLSNPSRNWLAVGSAGLFSVSMAVALSVFIYSVEPKVRDNGRHLLLLWLLLLFFAFVAKEGLGLSAVQPYLVPLSTLAMLVTVLFNVRLGLASHLLLCVIVGYLAPERTDIFWYYLAGGLVGVFGLQRVHRIKTFVWAGVYVMIANLIAVSTFYLLQGELDTLTLTRLGLASIANGALAVIASLGGYYLLGMIFQITTSLQLMDLARPTHPLMRELLLKAPGTYHHSVMVGNMAESAAEAIGADALLARVGAFYHDVGKTMRPYFFTENQINQDNPHDLLDPQTSAQIIRSHTSEGLALAKKYHLPKVLYAFITEHHGTAKIGYFFHKAVQEYGEENVQPKDYRHVGPRPQSKETAIVMMADTCEAAVRSIRPPDEAALEATIRKLIGAKISSGQLDNAPMTLLEIETITLSFVNTLQGVFHPRIQYPSTEKPQLAAPALPVLEEGTLIKVDAAPALPAAANAEQDANLSPDQEIEDQDDSNHDSSPV